MTPRPTDYLGLALSAQGKRTRRSPHLREAIRLGPKNIQVRVNLANVLNQRKQSARRPPNTARPSVSGPSMGPSGSASPTRWGSRASGTRRSPPFAGRSVSDPTTPKPVTSSASPSATRRPRRRGDSLRAAIRAERTRLAAHIDLTNLLLSRGAFRDVVDAYRDPAHLAPVVAGDRTLAANLCVALAGSGSLDKARAKALALIEAEPDAGNAWYSGLPAPRPAGPRRAALRCPGPRPARRCPAPARPGPPPRRARRVRPGRRALQPRPRDASPRRGAVRARRRPPPRGRPGGIPGSSAA